MTTETPRAGSLVLYKTRAARVAEMGAKLLIETEDGKRVSVRPKDVTLLHPGPIQNLSRLGEAEGDWETAWELLAGETTTLEELAELAYGEFTPKTAWAAWQLVAEGVHFRGEPGAIEARSPEDVAKDQAARHAKAAEKAAWQAFVGRVAAGKVAEEDGPFVEEIERLAYGEIEKSAVMRNLGRDQTPRAAHALLLAIKRWDTAVNPYPRRMAVPMDAPEVAVPDLPHEERLDLTHLPAFAIDDEGNQDPDDALSIDGRRLWVHVADAAAIAPPDSPLDVEARGRGATLYLPEGAAPMLPRAATHVLGLGLNDVSPALSFGLDLDDAGAVERVEVARTRVRVTRLTYAEADARLDEEPFKRLHEIAQASEARRLRNGALTIDLPEVKLTIDDGRVDIRPLPPLRSRGLVSEAMLMAGQAAARFAVERGIPFPFTVQAPPSEHEKIDGLAGMYALMRALKPSQQRSAPGAHAGLGLDAYVQATSPMRRYLDLVVHQQLRAHLRGEEPLDEQAMIERVGAAAAVSGLVRKAERMSVQHWTLVYLMQQKNWAGEGILVARRDRSGRVIIPDLALETRVQVPSDTKLNTRLPLRFSGASLPELDARFRIL